MDEIINKVAGSGLMSIDIKDFYPKAQIKTIDLKEQLFQELVLREKDFREWCKTNDWSQYQDVHVGVYCSSDAIIPTWAFMLVANLLEGKAASITYGNARDTESFVVKDHIASLDLSEYSDQRVIIKGCSEINQPETAFLELTIKLKPLVKSLMFGEACSSVPIYKKPK